MLLKQTIWKVKFTKQYDRSNDTLTADTKMQFCTDSIMIVDIVVPNVIAFLTDGDEGNYVGGSKEGCRDGSSEYDNDDDSAESLDSKDDGGAANIAMEMMTRTLTMMAYFVITMTSMKNMYFNLMMLMMTKIMMMTGHMGWLGKQ